MATFHEKLKEHRERAGMMQSVLAERSGLTKSHLNRIEKGQRPPPQVDTVVKMTEVLRLTEDEAEELVQLAGYSPRVLQTAAEEEQPSTIYTTLARPALRISPSRRSPKNSNIGQRIQQLLAAAELSEQEEEIIAEALEEQTRKMIALTKAGQKSLQQGE